MTGSGGPHPRHVLDRLENKFLVGDGCWDWIGAKDEYGYGRFKFDGRNERAHRIVYQTLVDPIPEGLDLDHLCRNRGCVRPDHLEAVSRAENCRRSPIIGKAGSAKTTCPKGHPYDDDNTRWEQGHRVCRTCKRERFQRWKARRAVA